MVSMCASLVERLSMVRLDVDSCSRIASILAAMVLTLAVSASRGLADSGDSTGLLLGGILVKGYDFAYEGVQHKWFDNTVSGAAACVVTYPYHSCSRLYHIHLVSSAQTVNPLWGGGGLAMTAGAVRGEGPLTTAV